MLVGVDITRTELEEERGMDPYERSPTALEEELEEPELGACRK